MNELARRKKELDSELEEYLEQSGNIMTMAAIGVLMEKLSTHFADMSELSSKKNGLYSNLLSTIKETILELKTAFATIQPPVINFNPKVDMDMKAFQPILTQIKESNQVLLKLVGDFSKNDGNENLAKIITSFIEVQKAKIERVDYSTQLSGIEKALSNRPTEFVAKVTKYNAQSRIDEITIKTVK